MYISYLLYILVKTYQLLVLGATRHTTGKEIRKSDFETAYICFYSDFGWGEFVHISHFYHLLWISHAVQRSGNSGYLGDYHMYVCRPASFHPESWFLFQQHIFSSSTISPSRSPYLNHSIPILVPSFLPLIVSSSISLKIPNHHY